MDNQYVKYWVEEFAAHAKPENIVWVNGSDKEAQDLNQELLEKGVFKKVSPEFSPNSFWTRSDPSDVARVEGRTFICSKSEKDAGPTNNWADPEEMKEKMMSLMKNCMKGRTLYVVPYMMGPLDSPYSKIGFELTDSPYVVLNLRIMARVGDEVVKRLGSSSNDFIKGLHSVGTLDPEERYICHFPDDLSIMSFNTGYGGNALQCKKCFALRIASVQARNEGWMAEHMLILSLTKPSGEKKYICAAFPSACGKTNMAMLVPPQEYIDAGWKVETVGDDIAWLRFGADGRLYAINPENGFFGVASGTSSKTNPNMIEALHEGDCIFTNTAFDEESMQPWWDDCDREKPSNLIDWLGKKVDQDSKERADHPNARFTCPASNCPSMDPDWESLEGVPISAIIFGGRRKKAAPLVYEALNWQHGTYIGATMASEKTAAASGSIGEIRRDPMAMKPFIGYHVGDYLQHWLNMGEKGGDKMPKVFHVNWFRKDDDLKYIWAGFGDNIRVLEWVLKRIDGEVDAKETPLGLQPLNADLNLDSLNYSQERIDKLHSVRPSDWEEDLVSQKEFLDSVGDKLPKELLDEYLNFKKRLSA